jgi:hypothetical protein
VWRELLAPDSPLVAQSWEMQDALMRSDPNRKTEVIAGACRHMSETAQHVLAGLALYHRHVFQVQVGDLEAAMGSAEEGATALGPLFGDVRRLGEVLLGLSRGWLYDEEFGSAKDLVLDTLEAKAAWDILDRIAQRKPSWSVRLRRWASTKLQGYHRELALAEDPHREIPYNPEGLPRRPLD